MKKLLIIFCYLYVGNLSAQILYVAPGTDFTIKSGTPVSMDSLVLIPATDFVINGNTLTKNTSVNNTAIAGVHIAKVFQFSNTTPLFSGAVRFFYQDGAALNGLSESDLRLHINNGTQWTRYNTDYINDPVNNFVLTNSIPAISLNEITLASSMSVLPVKWLGVLANRTTTHINVNWSAVQDGNSAFFVVEKSYNSQHWTALRDPIAASIGIGTKHYSSTDYEDEQGVVFYRIKGINKDGSFAYSTVAKVAALRNTTQISVYPNPVVNHFYLQYNGSAVVKSLQVLDFNGAVLMAWKTLQPVYNIQGIPAGTYSLRLVCADGSTQTQTITKL